MNKLILKLDHSNDIQTSNQEVKIQKIISSISVDSFIRLLKYADNKVNPRVATKNKITKSIHETLETSPELFWFKSKGILIATENCKILQRNRVEISFDNIDHEGIMDGGHNTFAIALYIIDKLFGESLKNWEECKSFWEKNFDKIEKLYKEKVEAFKFSIPVEIITPSREEGAINEFYDNISEICSARNNNIQLKETAKGNQVGCYDYLKEVLKDFDIIWKTGEKGKIKSEDVISLACLPLIFLKEKKLLPANNLKSLNKINIYSQKSKCIDFFNEVISHKDISEEVNGRYKIKNEIVKGALDLTKEILYLFDKIYIDFPNLYHNTAPGKFGRISAVEHSKKSSVPFYTTNDLAEYRYPYGFFYPLLTGVTSLMEHDDQNNKIFWSINPKELDLSKLGLMQYVELIKMVNYNPQQIGKGAAFYNESENIFRTVNIKKQ